MFFLDILTLERRPNGYPETICQWNYYFMLRTIPEDSRSQNMFNFSVSFHQENAKSSKINVFCDIISENTVQWDKLK
jgi:hypothetical protein